jgi:tetratricopeptide (TPR) repeat protein
MICRRAKRPIAFSSALRAVAVLLLGGLAVASEPPAAPATAAIAPELRTELHGYTQLAREAADQGKWPLADHFLELLVGLPIPDTAKKASLREIAESFEKKHERSKAIAMYEKMAELLAEDPESPDLLFRAAELYREAGAYGRAIARFYSVLNAALKVKNSELEAYRALTQRAQIEIAETHFLARDYEQSRKFCELALRLDLPPEQRARLQFRLLHCQYVLGDSNGAIVAAEKFLTDFPDDPNAPECRYLIASALRSVDRRKEALEAVLALLRIENARKEKNADRWTYWQKKTGNEFANDYYQRADFLSALTIYQTLAKLSEEPEWQWPVIYQMGLCFERLRLVTRAAEAYKYILERAEKPDPAAPPLPESVKNLARMARWRGEQLAWQHTTETQLQRLLGEPLDVPEQAAALTPVTSPAPTP